MYLKAKFLSIITNVSRDFQVPIKSSQLDYQLDRLSILNNAVFHMEFLNVNHLKMFNTHIHLCNYVKLNLLKLERKSANKNIFNSLTFANGYLICQPHVLLIKKLIIKSLKTFIHKLNR